jgi:RNA polymerase sigma factor (sigma-70 family)
MSNLARSERCRPESGATGAILARLFEQHGRAVYGLCRLLLRDPHEAEDAAQQTFLSAHRAMLSGVVPRDGGAWLATIARNECRSRVRTRMREPLALEGWVVAPGDSLDDTVARSAQVAELTAALRDLPEKQREAVLLRDLYGLGYGEIAAAIGATRPAVEALLFRARRRLQGRLAPLRDASAALLVPAPLRDALAEAIPGFSTGAGAVGAAAGVSAAKLASPLAAKVAAASLLVGGAGTTVAVVGSSDRSHHDAGPPAAVADAVAPLHDVVRPFVAPAPAWSAGAQPQAQLVRSNTAQGSGSKHDGNVQREHEGSTRSEPAARRTDHEHKHEHKHHGKADSDDKNDTGSASSHKRDHREHGGNGDDSGDDD